MRCEPRRREQSHPVGRRPVVPLAHRSRVTHGTQARARDLSRRIVGAVHHHGRRSVSSRRESASRFRNSALRTRPAPPERRRKTAALPGGSWLRPEARSGIPRPGMRC